MKSILRLVVLDVIFREGCVVSFEPRPDRKDGEKNKFRFFLPRTSLHFELRLFLKKYVEGFGSDY